MTARGLRVAVVGAGPAGAYAAGQLLSVPDVDTSVDLFDRLPTPWGLVRSGVAPDHPKIKTVTRVFERVAGLSGFRFCGNVEIGTDISHAQLARAYHAVIYAIGAANGIRLNVPGAARRGCYTAGEFVAWYNGHPDHAELPVDLSASRAVVVGNGNVALDVARILSLGPTALARTDVADHALAALRTSNIREVVVVGRRGPAQAAFTTPELRELGELEDVEVRTVPTELGVAGETLVGSESVTVLRNAELLQAYAKTGASRSLHSIVLRFCLSPREILGAGRVEAIVLERNTLDRSPSGAVVARGTGQTQRIRAGLVIGAVGYRSVPIDGVPFDDRQGRIRNASGRVLDRRTGLPQPGVYAAGWAKRGASGVVGTNKKCAQETVEVLLRDREENLLADPVVRADDLLAELRAAGAEIITHKTWRRIDAREQALGADSGRPRVKFVRRNDLLAFARES